MLVLTRKTDEQIMIGEDIKVTLVRVRGNTVRIGIEAPREVRIVRGELETFDSNPGDGEELELSDREQAFAHPQTNVDKIRNSSALTTENPKLHSTNRLLNESADPVGRVTNAPHLFVGKVRPAGGEIELTRAPLSGFVSAS